MANNYYRERNKPYLPKQSAPFKVSRSKIELFMQCPRCFWLDVRLKITRPSSPPFNINKTIDELFKKEFDEYRLKAQPHPLMIEYGVDAVPYQHDKLNDWRENFTGVSTLHEATNLHVFGAVDDLWINPTGQIMVVDYKATSKATEVSIDSGWQISYKRQIEVYQWLLRQNELNVADIAYFVYANGRMDREGFNNMVEFRTKIIPYNGNDEWIEPTLRRMKDCMDNDDMPPIGDHIMGGPCEFCTYAKKRTELTLLAIQAKKTSNK